MGMSFLQGVIYNRDSMNGRRIDQKNIKNILDVLYISFAAEGCAFHPLNKVHQVE